MVTNYHDKPKIKILHIAFLYYTGLRSSNITHNQVLSLTLQEMIFTVFQVINTQLT